MSNVDDDRVRQLLLGRRAIRRVPFPGNVEVEIGIRLLTDSEIDDARFGAFAYLEKRCAKGGVKIDEFVRLDPDALDREQQRQIIWRATFDVDSYEPGDEARARPFFPSDRHVRDLDSATVQVLWALYVDLLDAVDPRINLTDDQVSEVIDALGKAPDAPAVLAHFAPGSLANLARSMACRLAILPTGK